jgi:hypothetical protein
MHHRQHLDQRVHRRPRIDHHARLHPVVLDQLQRPVQMPADLLVDRDHVRPRLGKRLDHTLSSPPNLAAVLDHTLLKPEATRAQVLQLCHEAAEHRFACAMVNPYWVATAAEALAGTGVPVGVVIGFPLGATLSSSKRDETARVLKLGAHDVDMVLNIGLLKSGQKEDYEAVRQDIRGVVELAHGAGPSSKSSSKPACSPSKKNSAPPRSPSPPVPTSSRPAPASPPAAPPSTTSP